ncbi:MAG: hypothetical protein Kow0089_08340 [Desulfobulbaceae bacterium]
MLICLWSVAARIAAGREILAINEQFDGLDGWEPITFPGIDRHSEYMIEKRNGRSVLAARSKASASGIRYEKEFDVYRFPILRWRWRVENVYAAGNVEEKQGDDYPLRIYVMFKYDPENASFGEKLKYGLARAVYGAYPPGSGLNYIWANRPHPGRIYQSPYTDRARMIILRAGSGETGRWLDEEVNIVDDYRKAFGTDPPALAAIAVMNDSDNTGEASVSYLDFLQVLRREE